MREMSDAERKAFDSGHCPFCRGTEFYEGPSGGLCTNWKCANETCGAQFNAAALPLGAAMVGEVISEPDFSKLVKHPAPDPVREAKRKVRGMKRAVLMMKALLRHE